MGSGLVRPRNHKSGVSAASKHYKSQREIAAASIRQLLDPCESPVAPFPDGFHGRVETLTSTSVYEIGLSNGGGADGGRGVVITPTPTGIYLENNTSTYSTVDPENDANLSIATAGYKYMRCVGQCVKLTKTSAFDTPDGQVLIGCFPADPNTPFTFPANHSSWKALMEQNGSDSFSSSDGVEYTWCPRSQSDFVPFAPTSSYTSGTDINGKPLCQMPAINIYVNHATNTTFQVTVHTRWEGFLIPSQQVRGKDNMVQSSYAMDTLFSAIPQLCLIKRGSLSYKAANYAAKVAGVVASKGLEAVADKAIEKVSC